MKIIKIVANAPFPKAMEYLPSLDMQGDMSAYIGCRVEIKIRHRQTIGFIIGIADESEIGFEKLKPAECLIDQSPIISKHLLQLLLWIGNYYHCRLYQAFSLALPNFILQGKHFKAQEQVVYKPTDEGLLIDQERLGKRALKQKEVLELLHQYPEGLDEENLKNSNISKDTLKRMLEKNWLTRKVAYLEPQVNDGIEMPKFSLSNEQSDIISVLEKGLNAFQVSVCHGVTGSGKTEVYIQAIQRVLEAGKQVLVLVPEIGLTPQTIERFKKRCASPVVCMHSKMTDYERGQSWQWAKDGKVGIVIATRSGVFSEFKNLGMIILDEEHDASFKQQSGVRYHARDVAIMRAKIENIPVLLGSATPSLETLEHMKSGRFKALYLSQRAGAAKPCHHYLIDMRQGVINAGLSQQLLDKMAVHLASNNQVLIFINRRGFAPTLMCHDCGWVANCTRCEAGYTLHQSPQQLCCHHCGVVTKVMTHCETCQSAEISPVGVGTEQIEVYLKEYFKDHEVLRLDRDSTSKKGELDAALSQIHNHQADIIIGTQMIAKGHHFSKVTMVGIINVDGSLFSSDFRALEKMGQLIVQVSGRAGREATQGEVYLQTCQPDHPLLLKLLEKGYSQFSEEILLERAISKWPPYGYVAIIRAEAIRLEDASQLLINVQNDLRKEMESKVLIYGPLPGLRPKKAGLYRQMLVLKSESRKHLHQAVGFIQHQLLLQKKGAARWSIDVDPQEMM